MPDYILQIILVLYLMVFYNLIAHKVLHDKHQLAFSVFMSAVIIVVGLRYLNLSFEDLGFNNFLYGFLIGGLFSIILALLITLGSNIKFTKSFFEDSRVLGVKPKRMLKKTLIDIPITTVFFEEILFRGLLLGYFLTKTGTLNAVMFSSLLFGIWHILPALNYAKTNSKAKGLPILTVMGTVLFTSLAGLFFSFLRVISGSIIAPMMIHYVSNSGSYTASWLLFNKPKK